jgi:hypothetical protein
MIVDVNQKVEEFDPVWLLNQYRAAEISGAGAIMRMGRLADEHQLSADLSRHLRDETLHAWLWTKALHDIGGEIIRVDEPYQTRLAQHYGLPRSLNDLLVLTWVSERRGVEQYQSHLDSADIAKHIRQTLRAILRDEMWHVSYIKAELERRTRSDPSVQQAVDRALTADSKAIAELDLFPGPLGQQQPGAAPKR